MDKFNDFCDKHPVISSLLEPIMAAMFAVCCWLLAIVIGAGIGAVVWLLK